MEYSFDINIAKKYGVDCAIMIKHFQFWIAKNKANKRYAYDGRTWTYSSTRALLDLFPFYSKSQINRIISNLEKNEIIITGNYNKMKYDRTKWYAFVDEQTFLEISKWNSANKEMDLPKSRKAITETKKPIQDTNTIYYKDMIDIYNSFCINKFDAPAMINGVEGKSMKSIIAYLVKVSEAKNRKPESCKQSFEYILNNWNRLDDFTQKQVKLSQINSNLPNIINQLKNEKRNSNSIAEEILNKYK